jgi:hypothetical protein
MCIYGDAQSPDCGQYPLSTLGQKEGAEFHGHPTSLLALLGKMTFRDESADTELQLAS